MPLPVKSFFWFRLVYFILPVSILTFSGTLTAGFIYHDSVSTTAGQFNEDFGVGNLKNEGVSDPSDAISAISSPSGLAYATANPPTGGYPAVLTFEFTEDTGLNAFYLWNNATNSSISSKGIKDFTLTFYDGSGGSGNQIGSIYAGSAAQGPTTGSYAAESFVFESTYHGVRSIKLSITNNHLGSSWVGAREIGFDGISINPLTDASVTRVILYLVGGQSNADGYGDTSELSVEEQASNNSIPFYHGNGKGESPLPSFKWIGLQPGSGSASGNAGGFGPELTFGREMHKYLGAARTRIAIIKHAHGGSNLYSDWKAGGDGTTSNDGERYKNFQMTVASGLASLATIFPNATIQTEGMIWHQGETDVGKGKHDLYKNNLTLFTQDLRLTYGSQLRFVIIQLSNDQWNSGDSTKQARADVVQAAQQAVADASPSNALVSTSDLTTIPGNRIHFGTSSNLMTGTRSALKMIQLPLTDIDGNGLDDTWETFYFGSTGQNALEDPDSDGWNNENESAWQTNPHSSAIHPLSTINSETDALEWESVPSVRYFVEKSTDLNIWIRLESYIPATGTIQSWAIPTMSDADSVFYRLGVQK